EGFVTSSDAGVSFHWNCPDNYGDLHVGYYNGDGYSHTEANDQKAIQARVSVRPTPGVNVLRGLRVTGFYDGDNYGRGDKESRLVGQVTFEHTYVNAGFDWLDAKDQPHDISPEVHAKGYSAWVTPRTKFGLEGLLRYDDIKPDKSVDAHKKRTIVGVAYWFP